MAEWIEANAPLAYGALELKPWEFGRLTFGEFYQMVEGYKWRTEQHNIRMARLTVVVTNACARNLRKKITMETVLGYDPALKERQDANKKKSGRQLKAELSSLVKELAGR